MSQQVHICLHRGNGFISRAIRWQSRAYWNHASLWVDKVACYEAREFKGVIKTPYDERLAQCIKDDADYQFFQLKTPLDELKFDDIWKWAHLRVGMDYDYWSVLRFISRRKAPDNTSFFCSEFVFAALQFVGVNLLERIQASEVAPGHITLSPLIEPVDL